MAETVQERESLLTPEVKALIGYETEPVEMYDVVDKEIIRRFVLGIPDQDPRHWDEELAKPRFGGITTPALMLTYTANRRPPYEPIGQGMRRSEQSLPPVGRVAKVTRHLHGGDEFELFRYARLGDRIFFNRRYVNIEEKFGRSNEPFLLVTWETRYWNQDDETILVHREIDVYRP
jgi:hypothetical protein